MKKKQKILEKKEFEFTYRYDSEENNRDTTSDKWINDWNQSGHTHGEMSPIEICEGQVKSWIKSIQNTLELPHGDPNWVLKQIGDHLNMLKNWQYLLYCATRSNYNQLKSLRT